MGVYDVTCVLTRVATNQTCSAAIICASRPSEMYTLQPNIYALLGDARRQNCSCMHSNTSFCNAEQRNSVVTVPSTKTSPRFQSINSSVRLVKPVREAKCRALTGRSAWHCRNKTLSQNHIIVYGQAVSWDVAWINTAENRGQALCEVRSPIKSQIRCTGVDFPGSCNI